ncbi:MAG TPA: mandelate racemase/muconate lactonizing enzyme family protein [Burkholderiales bacterium]|nr:mandelate racemase/muconate lactonizing enzyme family protein [Burkholderiales bacterium]
MTWAYAAESSSDYALLKLVSDSGAVGIAEGVIKATRTGYSPRSLAATLEDVMLPLLRKVDLSDPEAVGRAFEWLDGNLAARALIDNACWAMRAAASGKPLWRQWGGKPDVPVAWIVTRQTPTAMAAEAAEMCRRHGLRNLKLKGGQGLETDLIVIAEVRAAVGDSIELSMDANRAYPQKGIAGYLRAIADAGITVIEDPCALAPDSAFEKLQRECPVPLLVDFPCVSRNDAALFLDRGARALMIKPGRIGLSEALAIDQLCAERGASVSLGMFYESAFGTALSLQAHAALKSRLVLPAEHAFFLLLTKQVTRAALEVKDGCFRLPDEPDLQRLADWKAVEENRI